MPKYYRKSSEYDSMTFEDKFKQALNHGAFEIVLEDILEDYYKKFKEYEDILGY
jgi:hypothetical protein